MKNLLNRLLKRGPWFTKDLYFGWCVFLDKSSIKIGLESKEEAKNFILVRYGVKL